MPGTPTRPRGATLGRGLIVVVAAATAVAAVPDWSPAAQAATTTPATTAASAPATTPGVLGGAPWRWLEQFPDGRTVQQFVPLTQVSVGRGGQAVWPAQWSGGTGAGAMSLRFTGLPAGVSVRPASLPRHILKETRRAATSCVRTGRQAFRCELGTPSSAPAVSPMVLAATGAAAPGRHSVTVALLQDGQPVAGRGGLERTEFTLPVTVTRRPVPEFLAGRVGNQLVKAGELTLHKWGLYRLAGATHPGAETLTITNVVAPGLRARMRVKGRGWSCTAARCVTDTPLAVGSSAPAVGMLWDLRNREVRQWPKITGAKAYQAQWWSRWHLGDRRGTTSARFQQRASLLPAVTVPGPKYRSAAQALAKVRRARLTVRMTPLGTARLRGSARSSIQVSNGGSRRATDVALRLRPPSHARVAGVVTSGDWRCQGLWCRWNGTLRPKRVLPPLVVRLVSNGNARVAQRGETLRAVVRWHAPGQRGYATAGDRITQHWRAPLRLHTTTTNRVVHSRSGIRTTLSATVRNRGDEQVRFRWRQVCPGGVAPGGAKCPAVSWVGHRRGTVASDTFAVRFTPPTVRTKVPLRFRVTAVANGTRVSDDVVVRALPSPTGSARWAPRTRTTKPPTLDEARRLLNQRRDPAGYRPLRPRRVFDVRINDATSTWVTPGTRARLRLRVHDRTGTGRGRVQAVRWRVDGTPVTRLPGATVSRDATVLTLRVPKRQRRPQVVTALVRHRSGPSTTVQELLLPRRGQPRTAGAPAPRLRTAAADGFCGSFGTLSSGDTLDLGSFGLTITDVVTAGSSCTAAGASLTLSAADVQIDGATLSGLTATMTSTGVTLAVASVTLPSDGASAPQWTLSGSLAASFSAAGLGDVSGTLSATNLSSLPYLALPDGWAVAGGTLSLDSDGSVGVAVTATGPGQGQASVQGSLSDGAVTLDVTAANVVQVTGYEGSTAAFGGSGTLTVAANGGGVSYDVDLAMTAAGGTFTPVQGVTLTTASLSWATTGLTLDGAAAVTIGSQPVTFSLDAVITDTTDWTATIAASAGAQVGSLPLTSLSGTFDYDDHAVTFDISVSVATEDAGSFLGVQVSSVTASILNSCPTADTSCSTGELRLELQVQGSVQFFGDTLAMDTTVDVELATGAFDATFSLAGSGFGPAEAQLDQVSFFVADDGASDPLLAGNACYDSSTAGSGRVYGFTATATILSGATLDVTGVYQGGTESNPSGSGYCFTGALATSQVDALDGLGLSDSLVFLYASYDTTADGTTIPAKSPTMWADVTLPSQLQTYLGGAVDGFDVFVEILPDDEGLSISGDVELSAYIAGSASSLPSFELTSIGMSLQLSTGKNTGVEVSFDADGVLTTPANSAGTVQQSSVDFDVSLGLQVSSGSGGGSLTIAANLAGSQGEVYDAFGVAGLDLGLLGISATIGFDALVNSSFTITAADVQLPGNVASALGLASTAPITFSLTVGVTDPCFDLAIGTPDQTTSAAIDWGGAGVLEAYYLHLLVAPLGNCTMSNGTAVAGNFAVAFDGYIFGTMVDVNAEVEIVPDFSADITADIAAFNVAGMDFKQTTIDIDFDPAAGTFDLAFAGGANLWDSIVIAVSGSVDIQLGTSDDSVAIEFDGNMSENLFGIFTSDIDVDIDVDAGLSNGTFYLNTLDIVANGDVKVLFLTAQAALTFDYADGAVQTLSGDVSTNVNLWIADFFGELAFAYDPAQTGNDDLALSIIGGMTLDLWLFTITTDVSITIDIDASFLASSEYHPAPDQQISSPVNPQTAGINTDPDTWDYQSAMYAGTSPWGGGAGNSSAILAAAGVSAWSSENLFDAGYFTGQWNNPTFGGNPTPASVPGIGTNTFPGGYVATGNTSQYQLSVTATQATSNLGQSDDPSENYNELEVTAFLPPSPMSTQINTIAQSNYAASDLAWWPNLMCWQGQTVTWTVKIPHVPNAAPGNWAWVMMDTNWRLYGSTLREMDAMYSQWSNIPGIPNGTPASTVLPTWDEWYSVWNTSLAGFGGPGFSSVNPMLAPTPIYGGDTQQINYDCGYTDFTTQQSLYDFMSEQGISWNTLPTPLQGDPYTTNPNGPLQSGWGASGWQPYALAGQRYGYGQAINVWVNSSPGGTPTCSDDAPEQVDLWAPTGSIRQVWADASDDWVSIENGNHLQVQASGNGDAPWLLRLFNSLGQELRWNGSAWVTEPSGGWTESEQPFSTPGDLYGADPDNGVVFVSGAGHATYLAFTADNPLMTQYQGGDTDPSTTINPAGFLNTCTNGNPVYVNPNGYSGS